MALLNAEEEVELAKRIEVGLYATQLMTELTERGEKLPAAQRRDMVWICRDGDRAKNHLLEANLRLVVSLAPQAAAKSRGEGKPGKGSDDPNRAAAEAGAGKPGKGSDDPNRARDYPRATIAAPAGS